MAFPVRRPALARKTRSHFDRGFDEGLRANHAARCGYIRFDSEGYGVSPPVWDRTPTHLFHFSCQFTAIVMDAGAAPGVTLLTRNC